VELIFWASIAIIFYVYIGYPLLLFVISRYSRPTRSAEAHTPSVSLVVAAYNEEKVLRDKIENSLALDYPKDQLEIVIASDGSTDATNTIAESYADKGIILHRVIPRGGKTAALNSVIPKTKGEILVLSDANTMYRPDAIRKLVRHFIDPTVGAVSGDVRLVDAAPSHSDSEGLYYRYERWLQELESRVGSIIGVDGGMYALARTHFRPPPDEIVIDDFVISMTVARLGYRVLYDPEAVAFEQGTLTGWEEFFRKVRIIAGGIQALKLGVGLPRLNQPFLLLGYVSHKLLRWLVPCLLLSILFSSTALVWKPFYALALGVQALFYCAALSYGLNIFGLHQPRLSGIAYYFSLVNSAALFGIWRGLRGAQAVTWQRTTR
jgi:cellulose synthase/poly-beta-1,6-N-acetylglucosamine synthase-like glycosyltransferase